MEVRICSTYLNGFLMLRKKLEEYIDTFTISEVLLRTW